MKQSMELRRMSDEAHKLLRHFIYPRQYGRSSCNPAIGCQNIIISFQILFSPSPCQHTNFHLIGCWECLEARESGISHSSVQLPSQWISNCTTTSVNWDLWLFYRKSVESSFLVISYSMLAPKLWWNLASPNITKVWSQGALLWCLCKIACIHGHSDSKKIPHNFLRYGWTLLWLLPVPWRVVLTSSHDLFLK